MEQIKETSLKFSESPLCPIAADVISDGESIIFICMIWILKMNG